MPVLRVPLLPSFPLPQSSATRQRSGDPRRTVRVTMRAPVALEEASGVRTRGHGLLPQEDVRGLGFGLTIGPGGAVRAAVLRLQNGSAVGGAGGAHRRSGVDPHTAGVAAGKSHHQTGRVLPGLTGTRRNG